MDRMKPSFFVLDDLAAGNDGKCHYGTVAHVWLFERFTYPSGASAEINKLVGV